MIFNNKNGHLCLDEAKLNAEDELIKDLLLKMLEVSQESRINAEQALQHPLFWKKGPDTPQTVASTSECEVR